MSHFLNVVVFKLSDAWLFWLRWTCKTMRNIENLRVMNGNNADHSIKGFFYRLLLKTIFIIYLDIFCLKQELCFEKLKQVSCLFLQTLMNATSLIMFATKMPDASTMWVLSSASAMKVIQKMMKISVLVRHDINRILFVIYCVYIDS